MSLFGQPAQPAMQASQGGLFGGVKGPSPFLPQGGQANPAAQSTGLFGQPQQQQQQAGGLFGQSTTGAAGGGLFGGGAAAGGTGGAGLFGQSTAGQAPGPSSGMFGQQAGAAGMNGGLFGQQQQQQQQPQQQAGGFFGQSQQQQQQPQQGQFGQGSVFGGNTMFGNSLARPAQSVQQPLVETPASIATGQLNRLWEAWNSESPNCQFQTYLYNQVDNEIIANAYEPGPSEDRGKFDQAMRKRPNTKAVPVLVRGFGNLKTRMEVQEHQIKVYRTTLHQINNKLTELSRNHDLQTAIKLAEAIARHQQLAHRVLSLSSKVQVLKNRGYALQPDEEALRQRLEVLMKTVSDPGVNGRMNEIWARMQMINQKAKHLEKELNETNVSVDPEQIQKMAVVLQTHERGIKGLREELQRLEESFEKYEQEKQSMASRAFGR